jgi:hypothetical protein
MGGRISTPTTSLAVTLMLPLTPLPWLAAARSSAATVLRMDSAYIRSDCAASVGRNPV